MPLAAEDQLNPWWPTYHNAPSPLLRKPGAGYQASGVPSPEVLTL